MKKSNAGKSDNSYWTSKLKENYGFDASLELLAGEFDLNFCVTQTDGSRKVMKVMRQRCNVKHVEMQIAALEHIRKLEPKLPLQSVIPDLKGNHYVRLPDEDGFDRLVWVMDWIHGCEFANFQPHSAGLIQSVGKLLAKIDRALKSFNHPLLNRDFKWDLHKADSIGKHLDAIEDKNQQSKVKDIFARYHELKPLLDSQPRQALHNDANDYNILVRHKFNRLPEISGLIDFGDMMKGSIVVELAVAGAYLSLSQENAFFALVELVKGYSSVISLSDEQVELIWPLLLTRLAMSAVNSAIMKQVKPDDPYVVISEGPIWKFLNEQANFNEQEIIQRLRLAAGLPLTAKSDELQKWLQKGRGNFAPILGRDLSKLPAHSLSVRSSVIPENPFSLSYEEAADVSADSEVSENFLGFYGEPRLIYTDKNFFLGEYGNSNRRTVHLGVDVFMPEGTKVCSPLNAKVTHVGNSKGNLDYGGIVTLEHRTSKGITFHTLYGHLDPASIADLSIGQTVKKGRKFAELGTPEVNGGWHPHLHFQLAASVGGLDPVWNGVSDPDDLQYWTKVFPNPAALLNLSDKSVSFVPLDQKGLLKQRKRSFVGNLTLSYHNPCMFLRGWKHYLFDEWGSPYLDAYNNVPHVGHANPRLRKAAEDQLARMNSNTRYLHSSLLEFAAALLAKTPSKLTKVFFVNSGSEANELALRLARAHSNGKDMVVPDHSYFGNTTGAISISPYKFNKPNGIGKPEWVQVVPVGDTYRGKHRGAKAAGEYAKYVGESIARIQKQGGKLAGFISETFPSVAGQIIPPVGYLKKVYEKVRKQGGVCIADEVQTGLGRLGTHYWAFEQQEVVPDIVVLGKPLGNGHPIGAVLTTDEIAESFDNGIEFFSTFGGSNLSCRIGLEVIKIIDEEGLQENAAETGKHLMEGLLFLKGKHNLIGDVRGMGLFVGVELVRDRVDQTPADSEASYLVNRLREERILVGTEGPFENVLKIRPPLTFEKKDADMLLQNLDKILIEASFLEQ